VKPLSIFSEETTKINNECGETVVGKHLICNKLEKTNKKKRKLHVLMRPAKIINKYKLLYNTCVQITCFAKKSVTVNCLVETLSFR
jgi:hypothetical protein